jgi:hypothetical protein
MPKLRPATWFYLSAILFFCAIFSLLWFLRSTYFFYSLAFLNTFACSAVISLGLGIWSQVTLGRMPKNYPALDYPIPTVAFPFEPLTELATECATRAFTELPLSRIPAVVICPAASLSTKEGAFYHPSNDHIYFKDTFANAASPEVLTETMTRQLLHAWLWQHRQSILGDLKIDPRTFDACYEVASVFVGVKKSRPSQTESWSTAGNA